MRSLAHIERIIEILPIEGADNIELIKVLGWQCVAKKGEVKVGDLVVYHEIDTITPDKPEYEFLKDRKFRIRTIKLRGQVSQGLILPLSILPTGKYKEGQDVTEILGLTHYDPESPLHTTGKPKSRTDKVIHYLCQYSLLRAIILPFIKKEKGAWPKWFAKTDEERVQNLKWNKIREEFGSRPFYVAEKCDGSSGSFFLKASDGIFKKLSFGVCSRNIWLKTPDNSLWWRIARNYNLEEVLKKEYKKSGREIMIQGECIGAGVNGNIYKYTGSNIDLRVFNVVDLTNDIHFSPNEMEAFCAEYGLLTVPILDKNFLLPETVDQLLSIADGYSVINPQTLREGLVLRVIENGKKVVSFKAISNNYLLKNKL